VVSAEDPLRSLKEQRYKEENKENYIIKVSQLLDVLLVRHCQQFDSYQGFNHVIALAYHVMAFHKNISLKLCFMSCFLRSFYSSYSSVARGLEY
jgi:hypothetical protein